MFFEKENFFCYDLQRKLVIDSIFYPSSYFSICLGPAHVSTNSENLIRGDQQQNDISVSRKCSLLSSLDLENQSQGIQKYSKKLQIPFISEIDAYVGKFVSQKKSVSVSLLYFCFFWTPCSELSGFTYMFYVHIREFVNRDFHSTISTSRTRYRWMSCCCQTKET